MKNLLLIVTVLSFLNLKAQGSYQKHLLTNGYSDIRGVALSDNGSYIITGLDKTNSDPDGDMYAMQINADGSIAWTKYYGFKKEDGGNHLLKLKDNNFLITGHTDNFGAECNGYLVKINADGDKLWSTLIGDSVPDDVLYASIEDTDGSIYSVGRTEGYGSIEFDFFFTKTDKDGNPVFQKHFGTAINEIGTSLCFSSDGNIILAGNAYDSNNNVNNFYFLSCDKSGNLNWTKSINNSGNNVLYKVLKLDNGIALFGQKSDSLLGLQAYAAIADNAGNILKEKTYGFKGDDIILSAQIVKNNILCLGYSTSYNDTTGDVSMLKLDFNLKLQSINFYGTDNFDQCRDFVIQNNGSIVMVGKSNYPSNERTSFIIKTEADASLGIDKSTLSDLIVYPNPTNGILNIDGSNLKGRNIQIYNATGLCILNSLLENNNQTFDINDYPSGVYVIKIFSENLIYKSQIFSKY